MGARERLVSIGPPLEPDEPSGEVEKRERAQANARLTIADARTRGDG
jgi:hypothetical protein